MSKKRILAPARLWWLAAAVAVLGTSVAHGAAPRRKTGSTLTFRTVTLSDAFSPGFGSPGSLDLSRIENRQGTRVIGRDQTVCVVIKLPDLQCNSTVGLPGGSVQVSFPQSLKKRSIAAAVTGGTGRYDGARGELDLNEVGSGAQVFDATLHLR